MNIMSIRRGGAGVSCWVLLSNGCSEKKVGGGKIICRESEDELLDLTLLVKQTDQQCFLHAGMAIIVRRTVGSSG